MKEAFYEESASSLRSVSEAKMYTVFKVLAIVMFLGAALILSFAFTYIPFILAATVDEATGAVNTGARIFNIVAYILFFLLVGGASALFWLFKNRFNVSYDYIFVEDELRVSKVFNGVKRKFFRRLKCDMMLKIGKCENDSFVRTTAGMTRKQVVYLTPNREPREGREFFYILYSSSAEKTVYVLESKTELIEYIVRAAGRNKWETR